MNGLQSHVRIVTATVATLALATLAACGGGDSAESATGNNTVRLVVSEGHSLPFIAAEAGEKLGVWDDKGIDVEIVAASSSTVGPTMASDNADISLQAGNKAAADIISGLESTLVAGCVLPWDQFLVASPESDATEAADLKGKKFGISGFGSAGHFATLKVAEELGWKKGDFEIVQLGSLESIVGGLQNGAIDAFVWSIEPVLAAVEQGYGKNLGTVADLVGPNAFEAFSVRNEYMESNAEEVKAFFEGYYEAVAKLQADPEWAENFVVEEWKKEPAIAKESVDLLLPILSTDGVIPDENLAGLGEAIELTVEGAGGFDISEVYTYWQDIG